MSGVVYFILFHCLMEVRLNLGTLIRNPFFSICFCEFHSDKGSSKINKSKDKSLLSLIKSFVLKHGFHLNLKTTVLKRNNSNAHVRSIFWGKAPVGCYQIKKAIFTSIYALYTRFHLTRRIVKWQTTRLQSLRSQHFAWRSKESATSK